MALGRRPGGLTALAVLNFVFAGLHALNVLGAVFLYAMAGELKQQMKTADDRAVFEAFENMNVGLWALILISTFLGLVLLIVAGVGYLKMRKWGRTYGNIYALISIVSSVLGAIITPDELGGGVGIATIIGLVYPLLTLYFVNATFKDDLVS